MAWEAFAHGAEIVSFFRWRQAPFGQEQMHAGLVRPDNVNDQGAEEARQVVQEIARIAAGSHVAGRAAVALVYSYEAQWLLDIQPQGRSFAYMEQVFAWYSALRALGVDVDICDPRQDLTGYRLIVAPSWPIADKAVARALATSDAVIVLGPRSGSKTTDYQIADGLPPGPFRELVPVTVKRVESLRPGFEESVSGGGAVQRWLEHVEGAAAPMAATASGVPVWLKEGRRHYVACWPDAVLLDRIVRAALAEAGLAVTPLPAQVRLRTLGAFSFAFNYGAAPFDLGNLALALPETFVLGERVLPAAGVAAWRRNDR